VGFVDQPSVAVTGSLGDEELTKINPWLLILLEHTNAIEVRPPIGHPGMKHLRRLSFEAQ